MGNFLEICHISEKRGRSPSGRAEWMCRGSEISSIVSSTEKSRSTNSWGKYLKLNQLVFLFHTAYHSVWSIYLSVCPVTNWCVRWQLHVVKCTMSQ